MVSPTVWVLLLLTLVVASVLGQGHCPHVYPHCAHQNWHIGIERMKPRGHRVEGHVSGPLHQGPSGTLTGTAHGSRVFGGPQSGAQTVGGALNYQHSGGLHGEVGASHTRGLGNSVSAGLGGSTRVGPGTLRVEGSAATVPGSSRVQGQVGATYSVPLP